MMVKGKYEKMKLRDIINLKYGKGLPKRNRIAGDYPVYGSGGIVDTHNEALVEGPGIIIGRKGSIGNVYYEKRSFYPIDTVYYVDLKDHKLDFYYLSQLLGEIGLEGLNSDAAVPGLNREIALSQEVLIPSPLVQRKIATILSAYDDLIENNLRRIKILEEIAQNLYREWFINFRFPGHEQARFVDSPLGKIPEGWEVGKLGDHLIALESGKRPKGGIQANCIGIPSVGAENVRKIGRHNYQSEKYIPDSFYDEMIKGKVKNGDVALYKDGAYIGRSTYFRDNFPHQKFCVNEHVFILRSSGNKLTQNILYLWLQEPSTIASIRSTNANAAQPGINQKSVKGIKIIITSKKIAKCFDDLVEPLLALIIGLAKKNNTLRQTRDLLLPKLISGEVEVSDLDIYLPEEALA